MDSMISRECPFCGGTDVDIEQYWEPGTQSSQVYAVCRGCGARGRAFRIFYAEGYEKLEAVRKDAAYAWNTRRRKPGSK